MNIALFTDTYPPEINGVATSTYNLQKTMRAHGHNVLVVATNPYSKKVTFDGEVVRVPGPSLKKLYGYRMTGLFNSDAFEIVRRFRPEVIHVQTDAGNGQFGFIAADRLHAATVYTFHTMYEDYTYYFTKGYFDRFARNAVRMYVRHKSDQATEFIAPSDKIKDYLRAIGIDGYINVIPTGIEFTKFSIANKNQKDVDSLKKSLHINKDEYVVLSLGRVAKEKSIDVCLRGYCDFLKSKPTKKTKMLIVGGGPALDDLKKLAEELGIADHVVFSGPVKPEETQRYYHLGDCFVSASITETQGLTFMEAMASSLVLLARYDDSLQNTITDGKNGYFFLSEEDFGEKLAKIIALDDSSKKKIIDEALISIDPYSMERFYQNVIGVYERARKKNW